MITGIPFQVESFQVFMLRAGKSVEETSEAVCYASRSHFIKTFASYTGMTPSRFRDQPDKEQAE